MQKRYFILGLSLAALAVLAEKPGQTQNSTVSPGNSSDEIPQKNLTRRERTGRSKGILLVPSKEMRTLPKVFLTAGVATQTQLKGWGGGGGGGMGGGGGWGMQGGGGWGMGGGGGGGGGWGMQGGGGGGGWGWGPPPGWGWGSSGGGGGGGHGGGGGWCPPTKAEIKAQKKIQKAAKKAQKQLAKLANGWGGGGGSSGGGGGWGGGGGGTGGGGGWGQKGGGGGGWGGGNSGGGGGGWKSPGGGHGGGGGGGWRGGNADAVGWRTENPSPLLNSIEADVDDDDWSDPDLEEPRGSRVFIGGSEEPRTFDMLDEPLPILLNVEDLPLPVTRFARSNTGDGDMKKSPTSTYKIRSQPKSKGDQYPDEGV